MMDLIVTGRAPSYFLGEGRVGGGGTRNSKLVFESSADASTSATRGRILTGSVSGGLLLLFHHQHSIAHPQIRTSAVGGEVRRKKS